MTLSIGDVIPPFTIIAAPDAMKVWAQALHDPNLIHLDPEAVKAKGLGDRVINQGPANLAYVMNALRAAFPHGAIEKLEARFLDNVFGGEAVEASGRVVEMVEENGLRRISCDVWLTPRGRDPVLTGVAIISESLRAG